MALVTLTKTPLLIWRRRRSCKILRGLGAMLLILDGGARKSQRLPAFTLAPTPDDQRRTP